MIRRFGIASFVLVPIAFACSDDNTPSGTLAPDSGTPPSDAAPDTSKTTEDSGSSKTTCEITEAWLDGCGHEKNCSDKYAAWCKANDDAVNSDAYRRAEAKCLTQENCTKEKRNDCEYRHYNTETPTTAQKALIAAYCATCEPGDTSCPTRVIKYDTTAGPKSVGDVFIAAWELNDKLCDEIRAKCTGPTVDAGATPAACTKTFGSCAADPYLNAVPECPK